MLPEIPGAASDFSMYHNRCVCAPQLKAAQLVVTTNKNAQHQSKACMLTLTTAITLTEGEKNKLKNTVKEKYRDHGPCLACG